MLKNILLIIPPFSPNHKGGASHIYHGLVNSLKGHGFNIIVLVDVEEDAAGRSLARYEARLGCRVIFTGGRNQTDERSAVVPSLNRLRLSLARRLMCLKKVLDISPARVQIICFIGWMIPFLYFYKAFFKSKITYALIDSTASLLRSRHPGGWHTAPRFIEAFCKENIYSLLACKCVVVSPREARYVKFGHVVVVPNGLDADLVQYIKLNKFVGDKLSKEMRMIFFGNLSFEPNKLAVRELIVRIFPEVQRALKHAELLIAGRSLPSDLLSVVGSTASITYLGYIDNLYQEVQNSTIMVAPFTYGGGLKNKILESLVLGTAVITTPDAAIGLPSVASSKLILERDLSMFASRIIDFHSSPKRDVLITSEIIRQSSWESRALDYLPEAFREAAGG